MKRNFLSVLDLAPEELQRCLALACRMKRDRAMRGRAPAASALTGAHVALLFDKPSLRTRTTFEVAVHELGGHVVSPPPDVVLGSRESLADVARNLERWVDTVVIRTFAHRTIVEFAEAAPKAHVVNALTEAEHPCQALADLMTLSERWGDVRGRTIAFVGDGNNVAASLAHAALMLGAHVRIASPEGYDLPAPVVDQARRAARHGADICRLRSAADAARGADAVYTDVWTSMGQEMEAAVRRARFASFQVTPELMALANPGALFMHCLPARRGEEVAADLMEAPCSVVFDQAENRLHTQKALLLMLMAPQATA